MQAVIGRTTRTLQTAAVKRWIAKKAFGFLETPDGEEVFFHLSNLRKPFAGRADILLGRCDTHPKAKGAHTPKVGELIAYTPGQGERGPMAYDWLTLKAMRMALAELQKRPQYRLLYRYEDLGEPVADPKTRSWITPKITREKVVWKGGFIPDLVRYLEDKPLTPSVKVNSEVNGFRDVTWVYQYFVHGIDKWLDCESPL